MEGHVNWLTRFANHYLGGVALALLHALHIQPSHPDFPIPEHVVMSMIVFVIGALVTLWLKPRLSVDNPGGAQQIAEMLITNPIGFGIRDLLIENAHDKKGKYVAMVGSVAAFILLSNGLSVFPLFSAPTGDISVPLGCAIVVFLYFNWQGIKHHTVGYYMLTFAGSPKSLGDWFLGILLFPVELISTAARLLSLTVRLWANIFASDLLYVIFLGLFVQPVIWGLGKSTLLGVGLGIFPAIFPLPFIALQIFVAIIQAYVFTLLPSIYIGIATADEH
ncbi:MAG TPA: F0F1 ATP synthase subunit A [Candidatus Saccharimonadales bacterium]|jgi:F-type H+-transporting ATPase subunit a|nr:F0F1 ATP synthase subunit A [Candidatus Saccharimonadales bacterium]